uniref:Putative transcriptional regulator n=1 Tax=Anopheles braziliensis TaxID=58242 RepID=A0A2M3ZHU5_9DIPT
METLPAINNPYPALSTVLRSPSPVQERRTVEQCHRQTARQQHSSSTADNWLYEIKQKGQDSTYYVMVQNVKDLVKSHLMFAVREEVEVLKERISELMDRINQLEYENNILKANASQETLSQLTTGGNSVAAIAAAAAAQQQQQQQQQQQVTAAAVAAAAATVASTAGSTKVPTVTAPAVAAAAAAAAATAAPTANPANGS